MADEVSLFSKLCAEAVGTFILVYTIGCNVLIGNARWGGASIGAALMVSVYSLGGISGAHFNPAVSLSLGISKALGGPGIDWPTVGKYCAVQVFGAIFAGVSYYVLFLDSFTLSPGPGFGWFAAGMCELIYTGMLCFVVLNVAVAKKVQPNEYYGLAIGFVIVAGAYGAGQVSGGCFNPAVAIGIDTASRFSAPGWSLMYIFFQILGSAIAAGLFMVVRPDEFGSEQHAASPLVAEFLGTYLLVLTVGLNVLGSSQAAAYSIAASLMCMIYALGDVSGAHFNPAVTVAVLTADCDPDFDAKKAGSYIFTQLVAGIFASCSFSAIHNGYSIPLGPGAKGAYQNERYPWSAVVLAEGLFTMVLCFIVLATAVSKTQKSKTFFGLAIGSCVIVGGVATGQISGGSLNPAVSFGIAFSEFVHHDIRVGAFSLYKAVIYSIFEIAGGMAAASLYKTTHAVDFKEDADAKDSDTASDAKASA